MRATLRGMRVIALAALVSSLAPAAAVAAKPAATPPASAAKPAGTATPKPVSTPEPAVSSGSGMEGRRPTDVLRFETLVIEGRVQTPEAVHRKDRSDVSFSELVPEESLLPRILEAVESEPF